MTDAAFVGLIIAFPLVGGAIRRWVALMFPLIGWPLFYVGLDRSWWGHGTGDGWMGLAVLMTAVGVVTTALVVWLVRTVRRPRE